mmetsp:Transcript_92927/g.268369  ORF Transcript_92927/g.268369 Transcript_92927/m.268369 type:complete len:230 (-) Transcript_92927:606-1295(-)
MLVQFVLLRCARGLGKFFLQLLNLVGVFLLDLLLDALLGHLDPDPQVIVEDVLRHMRHQGTVAEGRFGILHGAQNPALTFPLLGVLGGFERREQSCKAAGTEEMRSARAWGTAADGNAVEATIAVPRFADYFHDGGDRRSGQRCHRGNRGRRLHNSCRRCWSLCINIYRHTRNLSRSDGWPGNFRAGRRSRHIDHRGIVRLPRLLVARGSKRNNRNNGRNSFVRKQRRV